MKEGALGLVLKRCACSDRREMEDGEVEAKNSVNKDTEWESRGTRGEGIN